MGLSQIAAVSGERPTAERWLPAALIGIGGLTLWRVVMLGFNQTELWVDEAQYWLWGQSFAFGAFSKPPLIGWLIGLVTRLTGDSPFGVRLAAPLLHGATACVILALALRLADRRTAAIAALTYATMPAVSLASMLISTDTPLLLMIALALLLQHRLGERSSIPGAGLLGLAVGLGLLSKHAMIFAVGGMAAAAWVSPEWRLRRRDLAIAAVVALATVAPNLWWIAASGFVTFRHMAQSGSAQGVGLHPGGALRFLAEQFAVMGPVAFAAVLMTARRPPAVMRGPVAVAAVILGIVTLQAVVSRALANWGVGFTVTGCIAAAAWLAPRPRLTAASLGLGVVVALALPLLAAVRADWRIPSGTAEGGRLLLARYLGHADVSARAMAFARAHGAQVIAASDRDLLADLSWQARGTALRVAATPHDGPARHHWDLALPLDPATAGPVALLLRGEPPGCATGPFDSWTAGPGFAEGRQITVALVSVACLKELKEMSRD